MNTTYPSRNNIDTIRKLRGLTVDQLAERMGTTTGQVQKLKRGERNLTQRWMEKFAQALSCRPEDIIAENISHITEQELDESSSGAFLHGSAGEGSQAEKRIRLRAAQLVITWQEAHLEHMLTREQEQAMRKLLESRLKQDALLGLELDDAVYLKLINLPE